MTKNELIALYEKMQPHTEESLELFRLAHLGNDLETTKIVKDNAGPERAVVYEDILNIGHNLLEQDNRGTSYPMFLVRQIYHHRDGEQVHEYVTTCMTQEGAEAFIKQHAHNLTDPYVYVASGWKNEEWQLLRAFLLSLTGKDFKSKEGY